MQLSSSYKSTLVFIVYQKPIHLHLNYRSQPIPVAHFALHATVAMNYAMSNCVEIYTLPNLLFSPISSVSHNHNGVPSGAMNTYPSYETK